MIQVLVLLWGIFNLTFTLFFVIICVRSVKLIKEKFGRLTALVFVFGGIALLVNTQAPYRQTSGAPTADCFLSATGPTIIKKVSIDSQIASTLELHFFVSPNRPHSRVSQGSCALSGFVSGLDWRTESIQLKVNGPTTCQYSVIGHLQWKLMGISLFSQRKVYAGEVRLTP